MSAKTEPDLAAPREGEGEGDVWLDVIWDMSERRAAGKRLYGRPLTACDGRDSHRDLFEELLDALVYEKKRMNEHEMLFRDLVEAANSRNVPTLRHSLLKILDRYFPEQVAARREGSNDATVGVANPDANYGGRQ